MQTVLTLSCKSIVVDPKRLPWEGKCDLVPGSENQTNFFRGNERIHFVVKCDKNSPEEGRKYICYCKVVDGKAVEYEYNTIN